MKAISYSDRIREIISEYQPYDKYDELEIVARIIVATQEVKISTLQLWLNIKRKNAEEIISQLQTLKIISTYKNGTYEILISETELKTIMQKLKEKKKFDYLF